MNRLSIALSRTTQHCARSSDQLILELSVSTKMAIEFNCPECAALIRVPDTASGKKGTCPSCSVKLRVPKIELPAPAAAQPMSAPAPPVEPVPPAPAFPAPPPDPTIPARPDFMAPQQPAAPAPVQPPAAPVPPPAPAFPQPVTSQPPAPFPGPPVANAPGQPGELQFPAPPPVDGIPPVAPAQSIARQVRRRARKKSNLWFPLLCGLALAGGLGWMYLNLGPDIDGKRIGYSQTGTMMQPKTVPPAMINVPPEIRSAVLAYFESDPETMRSQFVETRFSATPEGLQIQVLTGSDSRFVRFPIDADLRAWYNDHFDELEQARGKGLSDSLKAFFTDWDVAIRNNSGVEDPLKYRNSVGLTSCIGGLGYHVEVQAGKSLYPCVYEDDGNLYFLLPMKRDDFKIIGRRLTEKSLPIFPGVYDVSIRPDSKTPRSVVTKPASE